MYKQVFEALPHVNEIWVTADGKFHLHPHNGGKHILRDKQPEPEQNEQTDISQSRRGRPKK